MTQPSQFAQRFCDTCGAQWPCARRECAPTYTGADMTPAPLNRYEIADLLGAQVTATVYGHIIALQAKEYPGLPGPTTAEIQLKTGGTVTLPLTALTLTDPT